MTLKPSLSLFLALGATGVVHAAGIPTLQEVTVTDSAQDMTGIAESASEGTVTAKQIADRPLLRPADQRMMSGGQLSRAWFLGPQWKDTEEANDIEYWGASCTAAEGAGCNGGDGFDGRLLHPLEPRTVRVGMRANFG